MKSQHLLLLGLCMLPLLWACQPKQSQDADQSGSAPIVFEEKDKAQRTADLLSPNSCNVLTPTQFCVRGPAYMKLGTELTWAGLTVEGATVKDTVFEEITDVDSFAWNVKMVRYPDGDVILESDFNTYTLLGRVRIETHALKTVHGIGVGSTLAELTQAYGNNWRISPYPEMELIELSLAESDHIFFHLPDPGNTLFQTKGMDITLEDLDSKAKISRVVIWDNTIGNPELQTDPGEVPVS